MRRSCKRRKRRWWRRRRRKVWRRRVEWEDGNLERLSGRIRSY